MISVAILLAVLLWLVPVLWAVEAERAEGSSARDPDPLPITDVILYTSGVGYFQRDGHVDGSAHVDLRFKTEDINDLLKSLVVQDLDGGQVAAVTYGSRDPIAKTLKSFGIDLTDNPSLGDLLNQVRGERIEVGTPNAVVGTIVGVEKKKRPAGRDDGRLVEVELLNLLTDDGLRAIALEQVQRIKLLEDRLATELSQALEVLAAGHDTQKKTVSVRFDGDGRRRVRVAYVAQTPVWKTSYRLVLDDARKPYLQGWAIVENTSDDDWDGVRLSLISGRPISFIMDLYQPLYAPRPTVQPELYLSLRPQVYGEAMEAADGLAGAPQPPPPARALRAMLADSEEYVEDPGYRCAPMMSDPSLGVGARAEGAAAGELFQYTIQMPVTLARQRSAMLPIVGAEIEGEKVSIYNKSVHSKHPLNGFRLKNASDLHLMQGPITVFDAGAYAGDARIEDLAPGGERLISYALDLKVEVEPEHGGWPEDLVAVALSQGTLIARRRGSLTTIYHVKNRDRKAKTVLVEHPNIAEWELKQPKQPIERTRDVYRFAVRVAPGKTESLRVREVNQVAERIGLSNADSHVLDAYVSAPVVSDAVKQALHRVIELRNALEQTRADCARREERIDEITIEQARIRNNMATLAQNSELYTRYVRKLDQQETELEDLRREIEKLKDAEAKEERALDDYLLGLDLEG